MKVRHLRTLCVVAVFILVGIALAFHTGWGTLSAMGLASLSAICPLGALESLVASHTVIPRTVISIVLVVAVVLITGRAFCSWACPVPPIQDLLWGKKARAKRHALADDAASHNAPLPQGRSRVRPDSRFAVLAAVLASTAVFGFPVFCLVCPIGLAFAVFLSLWYLFQFNAMTWGLVVFPALLAAEVLILRKWCLKICPISALLSLISRFNATLRPTVDAHACLRADGHACSACVSACPQAINLVDDTTQVSKVECTRCKECSTHCPAAAITFPLLPRKNTAVSQGEQSTDYADDKAAQRVDHAGDKAASCEKISSKCQESVSQLEESC